MTNNEINKYIHTEIMGKPCFHVPDETYVKGDARFPCTGCGEWIEVERVNDDFAYNPDYCSDDSPRILLNKVVAKVGFHKVGFQLDNGTIAGAVKVLEATTEQIARACVEAWRNK